MKKNIGLVIGVVIIIVLAFLFWRNKTNAPVEQTQTPASTGQTEQKKAGFSAMDVAVHNNADDCYTIVGDKVYSLTDWVAKHPGGREAIIGLCGVDATEQFAKQHGSSKKAQTALAAYLAGDLIK